MSSHRAEAGRFPVEGSSYLVAGRGARAQLFLYRQLRDTGHGKRLSQLLVPAAGS